MDHGCRKESTTCQEISLDKKRENFIGCEMLGGRENTVSRKISTCFAMLNTLLPSGRNFTL